LKHFIRYTLGIGIVFSVFSLVWGAKPPAGSNAGEMPAFTSPAPADSDTSALRYPLHDRYSDKYNDQGSKSPLYLKDPSNITDSVDYDPKENQYNINEHMGSLFYRNPSYMTFEEFRQHEFDNSTQQYWRQRASEEDKIQKTKFAPKIIINSEAFERIFGTNTIDIRPQGSAELIFGINNSKNLNPALPVQQRSITTFDFKEKIQMNVTANIGDKMKLAMNYNTEATFEFENKMKLEYTGHEDDIIKKIEAGNVTLPLNSQLIHGSQSLFGLKTQLQFGRAMVTAVYSQQKGQSKTIDVQGGAQTTKFDIKADQYEANRHFFLSQQFRNNYEAALKDINQIRSGINITRIEVWVRNTTSTRANDATRNLIAVADIGEITNIAAPLYPAAGPPDNNANQFFPVLKSRSPFGIDSLRNNSGMASSVLATVSPADFTDSRNYVVQQNARLLTPSEYTFNPLLGYISLNSELASNQIVAVAYEYTLNGQVYHVGELSTTSGQVGQSALFVKLLRSTTVDPSFFTWDLMMKNIYNLGGYQIKQDQFRLDVLYQDDAIGSFINFIAEGCSTINKVPLIKVLGLDKLNTNGDPQPDGVFDWKEGITVNAANGRIIFPVLEPFGSSLKAQFCNNIPLANKYIYQELYDTTRVIAQQHAEKNKFSLHGSYQSSAGNDIPLNAVNVPQGSVKVTAGGVPLRENVDYTVDYTLGRVKIINDAYLKSNTPIQISLESQSLFNIQTKTMWGTRFDYAFDKHLQFGATILHLSERPITQKVNYGDEPISNTVMGTDGTYRTDSRFLTNLLDRLPFYHTKEISTITASGEVAKLFAGHSSAIGSGAAGTSYIDDFEGAITPLDIKNPGQWMLASTPEHQHDLFPEDYDSLINGFNRARLAWYYVDNIFQSQNSATPPGITTDQMSNNYVRDIQETEIFPNKSSPYGPRSLICTNLAFYPKERGPYNYDAKPLAGISAGVDTFGYLRNPASRWGGIMRRIETTDFQNANIEFLQFWMMDPFAYESPNDGSGGDVYVNLGDVSEDILRDGHKCYENGLYDPSGANPPKPGIWGKYPDENLPQIGYNFDFDPNNRKKQDIGLDGLNDGDEQAFYSNYLATLSGIVNPAAYNAAATDPSTDDWAYFQSNTYNNNSVAPLDRYKKYNGMEGNSPTDQVDGYTALGSQYPDYEDLNRDFTLETDENYFQYHLQLKPAKMVIGQNYITDIVSTTVVNLPNNATGRTIKWYQIKIPIKEPQKTIGSPNLTYINAIRMFMRGFSTPVILRFAKMEFLRGEWRKYDASLLTPGELEPVPDFPGNTTFDLSYVNIEENSSRQPVNYVLPPGIERVRDISTTQLAVLNEQSLSLKVCNLKDGDARACYKTTQLDVRTYKKLDMYIHAESNPQAAPLKDGEITCFVRLGSDFVDNYYEYEVPLIITQPNDNNPDHVWPSQNNMSINLDDLVAFKTQRNNLMIKDPAHHNLLIPESFSQTINGATIRVTVRGSPNLSNVRTIMIGIRNPKDPNGKGTDACGEVWVNELRLSDFTEQGGWAATARVQAKLADLGNATLVGNHSSVGWGSLESKMNERDKADKSSYDFTTNLELGKFLPDKSGIKVPMFFEYSEQIMNPQYNPLDPDVVFVQSLSEQPNTQAKDSIKRVAQDYTLRKAFNFTNVKKTKTGKNKTSHFYDVENLSATYAYTYLSHNDYNTDHSYTVTHQGILGYNFNNQPKPVLPFSKSKFLNSPFLRLIKDFNFYYAPSSLSWRAGLTRTYSETQLRNNTGFQDFLIEPTYIKTFRMTRNYGLTWDFTKSIKFDFNADALATIDEPPGAIDTREARDSLKHNLLSFGRLTHYHHTANMTYNIPLSKIPIVDWVTASARYGVDYSWNTGALTLLDTAHNVYGINSYENTIQNAQTIGGNVNFNLTSLYNKVPYLKKINQPPPPKPPVKKPPPKPKMPLDSAAKAKLKLQNDSIKKNQPSFFTPVIKGLAQLLTSVKSASATYNETNGTLLPGFNPRPSILGMNPGYSNAAFPNSGSSNAPGWAFIMGSQATVYKGTPSEHKVILDDAVHYHWMTKDTSLNIAYTYTKLQNLSGRFALEPIKSLKIDVTFNRNYSLNHSGFWHADSTGRFQEFSPTETGNFSISYLAWNTHFVNDQSDYSNQNFKNFSSYRPAVSQILGQQNPNSGTIADTLSGGYKNGYGPTQQEVLTNAFLAAYAGKTPSKKLTNYSNVFPTIPMPNWRITYDGLSKLPLFQSFLQSFNLSHGYRSTYSVNSFTQNLLPLGETNYLNQTDTVHNFVPRYNYGQISISEQFAPLIGIDMTFKNTLQARFEVKRDRTVGLTYANIQVTEIRGEEYVIGTGYKIRKFKPPFIKMAKSSLNNDLNLKLDFDWRKNTTILRKLIEDANQPSAGSTSISIKVSADYNVSDRFNVKLFADKIINNPFVSTSFPTSNFDAGFSFRFTLAQ